MSSLSDSLQRLALGTVSLGMSYGLEQDGKSHQCSHQEAVRLLHSAREYGIRWFDTAPGYGVSEQIVGEVLGINPGLTIATKVSATEDFHQIEASVEQSLSILRRETLDVVQIHNATVETFDREGILGQLDRLKEAGKLRQTGVSVYGEAAALAAIEAGVDVLQIACSILDQRMLQRVIPLAESKGVQLMLRSIFLKGVLTERGRGLSGSLQPLSKAAAAVVEVLGVGWEQLSEYALRYTLGCGEKSLVLVGVSNLQELKQAVAAIRKGPLPPTIQAILAQQGLDSDQLLNPSRWPQNQQLIG